MSKDQPRNLEASVRHRLMAMARMRGEDFQRILILYGIERLLYRLSQSPHRNQFVLKGALLFPIWTQQQHRPTRDLDLLGSGSPSIEHLVKVFQSICTVDVEKDGLTFDPETVRGESIQENQDYEGVRLRFEARLGQARIDIQIDVGFGDVVQPPPNELHYPVMLAFPAPVLRVYSRESVIAEKFQAMVALGIANSRMKDFFDVWLLSRSFAFDGATLASAIQATFQRRLTPLSATPPLALTPEFGTDAAKKKQWHAFVSKDKLDVGGSSLDQVCTFLKGFLMPPTQALCAGIEFQGKWAPLGPWTELVSRS